MAGAGVVVEEARQTDRAAAARRRQDRDDLLQPQDHGARAQQGAAAPGFPLERDPWRHGAIAAHRRTRPVQGGRRQHPGRQRRRGARARHQGRQPRLQFRRAVASRRLRPPHRPYRPRGSDGRRVHARHVGRRREYHEHRKADRASRSSATKARPTRNRRRAARAGASRRRRRRKRERPTPNRRANPAPNVLPAKSARRANRVPNARPVKLVRPAPSVPRARRVTINDDGPDDGGWNGPMPGFLSATLTHRLISRGVAARFHQHRAGADDRQPVRQHLPIGQRPACEGCRRSINEIARWTSMTTAERDAVMAELPER